MGIASPESLKLRLIESAVRVLDYRGVGIRPDDLLALPPDQSDVDIAKAIILEANICSEGDVDLFQILQRYLNTIQPRTVSVSEFVAALAHSILDWRQSAFVDDDPRR